MTRLMMVTFALLLTVSMAAQQSTTFRLTAVHRNLSYVPDGHDRQTLDLYLPTPPAARTWEKPPAGGYKKRRVQRLADWADGDGVPGSAFTTSCGQMTEA